MKFGYNHGVVIRTRAEHISFHDGYAESFASQPSAVNANDPEWLAHVVWASEAAEDLVLWIFEFGNRDWDTFVYHWKRTRMFMPLRIRLLAEQSFYNWGEPWVRLLSGFNPLGDVPFVAPADEPYVATRGV